MNYSQDASQRNKNQRRKRRHKKKTTFGIILLRIIIVIAVVGCFIVGGAFLGAFTGIIENAPEISTIDATPESFTSILYDSNGKEIDTLHGEENREYVKLSQIPENLQNAVISIEDERFYEHNGIDFKGMLRAMAVDIKTRDFSQGASTITQQLMKNEVLTSEKKISRKLQEQYLAVNFEKELTKKLGSKQLAKQYILELYLNTISLNHGLNGVQAAAKYYYGKDVSELSLAQCASIAGITKNPSAYSPVSHPENNVEREHTVLAKMLQLGYVSQSEYDQAMSEDITSEVVGENQTDKNQEASHSYFVDSVIVSLAQQLMNEKGMSKQQAYNDIYSGGLQIYTTEDTSMQNIMEKSFSNDSLFPPKCNTQTAAYTITVMDNQTKKQQNIYREKVVSNYTEAQEFAQSVKDEVLNSSNSMVLDNLTVSKSLQAAMVIMDQHNGQVKAIVGGREKTGDLVFNRATQAYRQPGSCFKVLASYAPAIDKDVVMPGTCIEDEPFDYNGWKPKNWYSTGYRGTCTVRDGIRDSMNILAAKVITMVGVDTSIDYLLNFGFTSLQTETNDNGQSDRVPAIALGGLTNGVSVLELTAAYATIANGGVYNKPIFYTKVLDHDGNILIDNTNLESKRVLKATTAYMLTDMMKDVISTGTGRLAKFSSISMPESGKTGTTTDDKDLCFAGYTPYYCAGIWMGYDNPKKIVYDKSYHLLLWKDVMEKIHQGLKKKDFDKPDGIVYKKLYAVSNGTSPHEMDYYGNTITNDLCASGYSGKDILSGDYSLKTYKVCSVTGKLAGDGCDSPMDVVLATDDKNNILNEPSEAPKGKLLINLHETCNEHHNGNSVKKDNDDDNEAEDGGILSSHKESDDVPSDEEPNINDKDNKNNDSKKNDKDTNTDKNKDTQTKQPPENTTEPDEPTVPNSGSIFGQ
ncbi:MAG: penicillin-binding protein [Clostridia bacterium]|jgi:penicillin-binding protein 1A|nr:penicillin-binding protein [Clostridia bacterium]